jgi:hypothetical protein
MLAPLGATVAAVVVAVLFEGVTAVEFATGVADVVEFCDRQADSIAVVMVVMFVLLLAGPNDAPPGADVATVWLLPEASAG